MVNAMSNEEDQCFQCQELGHTACYCQTYIISNAMNTVILQQTVQREYHCQTHLPTIRDRAPTQDVTPNLHLGIITKTGIRIAGQGHSLILTDTAVIAKITHIGVTPGHITDTTTEALHNITTPALIITAMTQHTGDHPHTEVP